jgi:hypothetical protein
MHCMYLSGFVWSTKVFFSLINYINKILVNIEVLTNIGITADVLELHYQNSWNYDALLEKSREIWKRSDAKFL